MAINLAGRIPSIRQATSPASLWLVGGLFALVLVAVAFGFYYRIRRQEAQRESQQEHTIAADASTSNRVQIEGGDSSGLPVAPKSVPMAPAAPAQAAVYQPYRPTYYPAATKAAPHPPPPPPPARGFPAVSANVLPRRDRCACQSARKIAAHRTGAV